MISYRFVTAMLFAGLAACASTRTSQPVFASVTGTLTYLQRIALPSEAIVIVQLLDVTGADVPAAVVPAVIAEQRLERPGRVPIAFDLRYDNRIIDTSHRYTVSARILRGSRLLFINEQSLPVITHGNPARVEIVLKMVPQSEN